MSFQCGMCNANVSTGKVKICEQCHACYCTDCAARNNDRCPQCNGKLQYIH